jgi:hypothetical protein
MELYPSLAKDVVAFVAIAGANHGTSVCRGLDTTYYGCNEIAPGTAWLAQLNAHGESPRPTRWMTICNCSDSIDPLFADPRDWTSPMLAGADNVAFPTQYHNDLRVGKEEVDTYLPFLLRFGQAGPAASPTGAADAAAITATQPDGTQGMTLCGVPKLTGPVAGCPPPPAAASAGPAAGQNAGRAPDAASTSAAARLPDTSSLDARAPAVAVVVALAVGVLAPRSRRRRGTRAGP